MTNKEKITENFGAMLFSESVMKKRLSPEAYETVRLAKEKAFYSKNVLLTNIERLRKNADSMELLIGKQFLPYPSYEDILYSVKY